ncbi:MAG: VOC family protein [Candidatus Neomarinimicrobiota bacterium]|jgi:catechol 2,3-dioxygenase-like lactoylglutathione lyase family enzyme|nr:VOC family protein [Candidatus Neomarinimicrobiota bacterium]HJP43263.1 VOC family protein [Gammaproteobacteria bacterium]|tara:strand:+ start:135 stop:602 length:468 start_codon:yes stop_codon:yes gene_type:complete
MATTTVKRTTLIVRNIEASSKWYEEILDMSLYYDDTITLSGKGLAAGKKGDVTHLKIYKCSDPIIGMIGLLQWLDPELPAPEEIPTEVNYGNPTFVVDTDNVDEVYKKALALGTHIHSEPHEWSVRGADGNMINFITLSVFDPDGYFYEINQRLT